MCKAKVKPASKRKRRKERKNEPLFKIKWLFSEINSSSESIELLTFQFFQERNRLLIFCSFCFPNNKSEKKRGESVCTCLLLSYVSPQITLALGKKFTSCLCDILELDKYIFFLLLFFVYRI